MISSLASLLVVVALCMPILAAATPTRILPAPSLQIFFTDNLSATAPSPGVTPMEAALLERLDAAEFGIDGAIYDFNRESVRDALIAAKARGVNVRIVADDEARNAAGYAPSFDALAAAGIPIVVDAVQVAREKNSRALIGPPDHEMQVETGLTSGLMHDKYFIVDNRWVWTGSVNMSNTDMTLNHNNALLMDSPALAAVYEHDFGQMAQAVFGTEKSESVTTTATISGVGLQVQFAPQDDPMAAIIAAVNDADESIDFAIFYFTYDGLRDALLAAHNRGVRIRGLWDELGASDAQSEDETLCSGGIAIKIEQTPGKMHHKLMVIDAAGAEPEVITGSLNWTAAATEVNNENTLILMDGAIARAYVSEFQKMWDHVAVAPCNPETGGTRLMLPVIRRDTANQPGGTNPVRIVRIVYDPPGADAQGEFVELQNAGSANQPLGGWKLQDVAGNTFDFPSVAVAAGDDVRVWVRSGMDTGHDLYWGRDRAIWNNDGDRATLYDAQGNVTDSCSYAGGGSTAECLSGKGE